MSDEVFRNWPLQQHDLEEGEEITTDEELMLLMMIAAKNKDDIMVEKGHGMAQPQKKR